MEISFLTENVLKFWPREALGNWRTVPISIPETSALNLLVVDTLVLGCSVTLSVLSIGIYHENTSRSEH